VPPTGRRNHIPPTRPRDPPRNHRPQHRIPSMADHRCSPQNQPSNNDTLNRRRRRREHCRSTIAPQTTRRNPNSAGSSSAADERDQHCHARGASALSFARRSTPAK
jgi:hypothetical protein